MPTDIERRRAQARERMRLWKQRDPAGYKAAYTRWNSWRRSPEYVPVTPEQRFWRRVEKSEGCWLWVGRRDRFGYGTLEVSKRRVMAHRFSWELAAGPVPTGMHVCHRCDNPPCVRPDHLFLGTQTANMADKVSKNRQMRLRDRPDVLAAMHRGTAIWNKSAAAEANRKRAGPIGACKRWRVDRGKPCVCGRHITHGQ